MKNINGHVIIKDHNGDILFEGDNLVFACGREYLANCIKKRTAPEIEEIFFSNNITQPVYDVQEGKQTSENSGIYYLSIPSDDDNDGSTITSTVEEINGRSSN